MSILVPATGPDAHVLRIEHQPRDERYPLHSHNCRVLLDDKPLDFVKSIRIRYAVGEIVTAVIELEVHMVEIRDGAAKLEFIRVEPEGEDENEGE